MAAASATTMRSAETMHRASAPDMHQPPACSPCHPSLAAAAPQGEHCHPAPNQGYRAPKMPKAPKALRQDLMVGGAPGQLPALVSQWPATYVRVDAGVGGVAGRGLGRVGWGR